MYEYWNAIENHTIESIGANFYAHNWIFKAKFEHKIEWNTVLHIEYNEISYEKGQQIKLRYHELWTFKLICYYEIKFADCEV